MGIEPRWPPKMNWSVGAQEMAQAIWFVCPLKVFSFISHFSIYLSQIFDLLFFPLYLALNHLYLSQLFDLLLESLSLTAAFRSVPLMPPWPPPTHRHTTMAHNDGGQMFVFSHRLSIEIKIYFIFTQLVRLLCQNVCLCEREREGGSARVVKRINSDNPSESVILHSWIITCLPCGKRLARSTQK